MEIRKTNLHLAYSIAEKPEGGFIACSDDPNLESIEAPTKAELFEKMRAKTAELIGKEIPLDAGLLKTTDPDVSGARMHVDRKIEVNLHSRGARPLPHPNWVSDTNPQVESRWSSGSNLWKVLFFVLLALVLGWFFLR